MNTFVLQIKSPFGHATMEDVTSFTGIDASGSFGIFANHERMMTVLDFGFVTVRRLDQTVQYIAMPGGILYFLDNTLFLVTNRYFVSDDYKELTAKLNGQIAKEEAALFDLKESLRKMEQSMFKHLYRRDRSRSLLV